MIGRFGSIFPFQQGSAARNLLLLCLLGLSATRVLKDQPGHAPGMHRKQARAECPGFIAPSIHHPVTTKAHDESRRWRSGSVSADYLGLGPSGITLGLWPSMFAMPPSLASCHSLPFSVGNKRPRPARCQPGRRGRRKLACGVVTKGSSLRSRTDDTANSTSCWSELISCRSSFSHLTTVANIRGETPDFSGYFVGQKKKTRGCSGMPPPTPRPPPPPAPDMPRI